MKTLIKFFKEDGWVKPFIFYIDIPLIFLSLILVDLFKINWAIIIMVIPSAFIFAKFFQYNQKNIKEIEKLKRKAEKQSSYFFTFFKPEHLDSVLESLEGTEQDKQEIKEKVENGSAFIYNSEHGYCLLTLTKTNLKQSTKQN